MTKKKTARFVLSVEVEVVDPLTVAANTSHLFEDEHGELRIESFRQPGMVEGQLAQEQLMKAMHASVAETGLAFVSGEVRPVPIHEDGYYDEVTLLAQPRTDEDGVSHLPPDYPVIA